MPSRLSSLLVRDGLVGVKRMEKAFQRQVIYGGTLDTILLEMNLVPEERLTQYLALASGLPPAARDEGRAVPADVAALIAYDVSQRYRAVPVAVEGEAIRILVCAPIDIGELEDLADLLDRPLQPLITPEFRWNLVYAGAYGLDPPARYTTLARAVDVDPTTPPVGRARSVIISEDEGPPRPPGDEVPVPQELGVPELIGADAGATQPMVAMPQADDTIKTVVDVPIDEMVRSRRMTLLGVDPNRAVTEPTAPMVVTRTPTRPMPAQPGRRPSDPKVQAQAPKINSAPISTEGRDSPVPVVRAREMLATAEDRDSVFLTVLRAARSRARWAGLLTVQGGAAIGRVALAEPGLDASGVQSVLIPLDAMSPFRAVVANQQPHIGPIETGEASIDEMLLRLGGTMPPSALLMPIVLRDRVVAVVAAHRVHSDIRLAEVTELLPIATAASDALGRLIVRHKAAGYRAPTEVPVVEIEADLVDTKRLSRKEEPRDGEGWSAPSRPPTVPAFEQGIEMSMEAEPPQPIDEVLDAIEAANESEAEDAIADAIERPQEAIAALARRFPGKLRVERFAVAGRPLRAAQYGGLLELVVRLGPVAAELLIEKMGSPQRDTRFYATICTAELRPRNAIYALAERVFDQDYGVRASAIEALAGYPLQELGNALNRARRAVHSSDPEVVAAATTAIVELGDTGAIADLIGVIERADRAGEHARRALISLTAQDFGPSEKKWRKWFDGARNRHRIEWLIEGLSHKEDAIRETAINDLRRLTGEYFGYHHDLPKKERDLAAHRWLMWWRDVGRRRFVTHEDERHRPTALLPLRRD